MQRLLALSYSDLPATLNPSHFGACHIYQWSALGTPARRERPRRPSPFGIEKGHYLTNPENRS